MGEAVAGRHGEIRSLRKLLKDRKIEGALQFDLLDRGRSIEELGETLSWWDLECFIEHLPAESAYKKYRDPEGVFLTPDNMLRILAADGARGTDSLWKNIIADPAEKAIAEANADRDETAAPSTNLDPRAELAARRAAYAANVAAQQAEQAMPAVS